MGVKHVKWTFRETFVSILLIFPLLPNVSVDLFLAPDNNCPEDNLRPGCWSGLIGI